MLAPGRALARPLGDARFRLLAWLVVGGAGWLLLAGLAVAMLSETPPTAGFDLALVLEAGRRVAAGGSPYDPALAAGSAALEAADLFHTYPPPVAQAASIASAVPLPVALGALWVAAVGGLAGVAAALARRLEPSMPPLDVVVPVVALAPYVFPFSVALLFGNLDALYPLAFGLLL
ncbi:MAG TPA: hypothetical protein VNJ28_01260, partial [Candidatus Limnocylindrales bacterium]|nr:hypothetical protein [Candidatus Limnocylindrales bacterium]